MNFFFNSPESVFQVKKSGWFLFKASLTLYLVPGVSPVILNGDAAAAHIGVQGGGGIIDHGNVVDVVTQPVLSMSDGRGFPLDVNGVSQQVGGGCPGPDLGLR